MYKQLEQQITLSMDDVRKANHNLAYYAEPENPDSFLKNYRWTEDTKISLTYIAEEGIWEDKNVIIYGAEADWEFGYVVSIEGEFKHIIGIYEPHGVILNEKRGLITVHGHEEIVQLWLSDGEFESEYTR